MRKLAAELIEEENKEEFVKEVKRIVEGGLEKAFLKEDRSLFSLKTDDEKSKNI